jgi:hypothetical protein
MALKIITVLNDYENVMRLGLAGFEYLNSYSKRCQMGSIMRIWYKQGA